MKELLAQSGLYGQRLQGLVDLYRGGMITSEQAIEEVGSLNNEAYVGGRDIADILFWALQNSVE